MKTTKQSVLNHLRSLNPAGRTATARNGQPRRRSHLARALCGVAVAWLAIGASRSYGDESLNWQFAPGIDAPGGTITNGATVTEAYTHPQSGYYYIGTINAGTAWSDLTLSFDGASNYGVAVRTSSRLDLWAYNQPGQTGPITVTITPHLFIRSWHVADVPAPPYQCGSAVGFTLRTYHNGVDVYVQEYETALTAGYGISVTLNNMSPYTMATSDGDRVAFAMGHTDSAFENSYLHSDAASLAWYSVSVSPNGYLSTGPRDPANPPIPVVTDSTPQTTSVAFTDGSHTQMTVSGIGGPTNVPLPYLVMTTTNLALPLANWSPVLTNNFTSDGTFSYSFPINANEPQRFFQVQMAQ